jgi:hypothetical protein
MSRSYIVEMRQARQRVAAVASTMLDTRWGAVEYVDQGDGLALVLSHGVLGGHDNVRELVNLWFGPQYRAIGPSRFGYSDRRCRPRPRSPTKRMSSRPSSTICVWSAS